MAPARPVESQACSSTSTSKPTLWFESVQRIVGMSDVADSHSSLQQRLSIVVDFLRSLGFSYFSPFVSTFSVSGPLPPLPGWEINNSCTPFDAQVWPSSHSLHIRVMLSSTLTILQNTPRRGPILTKFATTHNWLNNSWLSRLTVCSTTCSLTGVIFLLCASPTESMTLGWAFLSLTVEPMLLPFWPISSSVEVVVRAIGGTGDCAFVPPASNLWGRKCEYSFRSLS